jgi:hypothetical protein
MQLATGERSVSAQQAFDLIALAEAARREPEVARFLAGDVSDIGPLRDALQANKALIDRLEAELHHARGSFGLGINGFGVALAYALWQIMRNDHPIDAGLAWEAAGVAIFTGLALEAANFFFLAKRQRLRRLGDEIDEARTEGRSLEQKIREASRV